MVVALILEKLRKSRVRVTMAIRKTKTGTVRSQSWRHAGRRCEDMLSTETGESGNQPPKQTQKKSLDAQLLEAGQCPFCLADVPAGVTVCRACGAFKQIGRTSTADFFFQILVVISGLVISFCCVVVINGELKGAIIALVFAGLTALVWSSTRQIMWYRRN